MDVVEDLADDGGIRHIGNDPQASTAVRAERDIELEGLGEPRGLRVSVRRPDSGPKATW